METKKVTITIPVKTNISTFEEKVDRLNEIMKEASTIIKELASMDVELEFEDSTTCLKGISDTDVDSIIKRINERTIVSKCQLIL